MQEARATTLASTVSNSADVVRVARAAALAPIREDIADLRRAQYEAQGQRTQVVESRGSVGQMVGIIASAAAALMLLAYVVVNKQTAPNITVCVPTATVPCP